MSALDRPTRSSTSRGPPAGGILAFTVLSMLPALGCFIFAQRHLVGGFTGAVKG